MEHGNISESDDRLRSAALLEVLEECLRARLIPQSTVWGKARDIIAKAKQAQADDARSIATGINLQNPLDRFSVSREDAHHNTKRNARNTFTR